MPLLFFCFFYSVSNGFIIDVEFRMFLYRSFWVILLWHFLLKRPCRFIGLIFLSPCLSYMSSTRFGLRRCGASRCLAVRNDHVCLSVATMCVLSVCAPSHDRTSRFLLFCIYVPWSRTGFLILPSPPKGQCPFLPYLECCGYFSVETKKPFF